MRLFLDAHVSGRRVARALRKSGHDVRAADEERELDGLPDEELLSLATAEQRILITFNVADFPRIVRQWAEAGRPHAGCAIVIGIDHSQFGTILRVLERTLADRADPRQWNDDTCFLATAD